MDIALANVSAILAEYVYSLRKEISYKHAPITFTSKCFSNVEGVGIAIVIRFFFFEKLFDDIAVSQLYCSNILIDVNMNAVWDSANINIKKSHRFLSHRSLEKGEWALS